VEQECNLIIYITRHGQPALDETVGPGEDNEHPPGDPVLSLLGRQQAACLGYRLATQGFKGLIFSSPYRRTLETAQIVAEIVHGSVIPEPALQEYVLQQGVPDFIGLAFAKMRSLYPNVDSSATMPYPWFAVGPETVKKEVKQRVRGFLNVLGQRSFREALLVGHGASIYACLQVLLASDAAAQQDLKSTRNWNCSLSIIKINRRGLVIDKQLFDISHLPRNMHTSNALVVYQKG